MVFLVVISLILAVVALAFAVLALLRARAAEEQASAAVSAISRAESTATAAARGVEQLESQISLARGEAAAAAQQASKAGQAAAQASAAAAASRREAEEAADKAQRAEAELRTVTSEISVVSDRAALEAQAGTETATPPQQRAMVRRAEAGDVSGNETGITERVVQVSWRLERVRGATWVLRNTGLAAAHDALLSDATLPPKFIRPDEVIPRDVDRDDVLQFRILPGRGGPPPRIRVTWRENAGSPAYSREFTVLTGA